jgi:hypothetical protein
MSNKEKSVRLKECLLTIGIHPPQLTRFIHRSIELDKQADASRKRADQIAANLERLQAETVKLLLGS